MARKGHRKPLRNEVASKAQKRRTIRNKIKSLEKRLKIHPSDSQTKKRIEFYKSHQ